MFEGDMVWRSFTNDLEQSNV